MGLFDRFKKKPPSYSAQDIQDVLRGRKTLRDTQKKPLLKLPKNPVQVDLDLDLDFDVVRDRLLRLRDMRLERDKANKIILALGAVAALGGVAADVMFLGGIGTLTVATCLFADFRNAQQIKKISGELEKLDDKIDLLRKEMRDETAFRPALSLLKKTVVDFEAAAQKDKAPEQENLAVLRRQIEALEQKLDTPAGKPPAA